ncbi:unnamed protein product [Cylicocyclus nassatus]|uniref:Lipoprotein n=1 Tax=Cylicocyclus nassatus TaxID=53992 RepID=A0AA36GQN6_CYLNA|nr:unnamed protein product [Cylicocyclus nassatus]
MTTNISKIALPLILASSLMLTACSNDSQAPAAAEGAAPAAAVKENPQLTHEQISNKGTAAWPTSGTNPVTVGVVQLLDPAPGTAEPARGEEARVPMTGDVQPHAETEVTAVVPGDFAAGHKVRFELLQEGVAWFGYNFQQPVLVLGPFARCADGKGLCDDKGAPIAAATP